MYAHEANKHFKQTRALVLLQIRPVILLCKFDAHNSCNYMWDQARHAVLRMHSKVSAYGCSEGMSEEASLLEVASLLVDPTNDSRLKRSDIDYNAT